MIDERARRALMGNVQAWRAVAGASGRVLIDRDGVLTYFSTAPNPNFNPTVVYAPVADPAAMLDEREAAYAERGIRFGFEVPAGFDEPLERLALDRGFTLHNEMPAMVLHPVPPMGPPDPRVLKIDASMLDEHLRVQAEGFGDPFENVRAFTHPSMLTVADMFLARQDGVGVATSLVCVTGREAGVFAVATVPAQRRRGIGRAVTAQAVRAAAAAGADFVWLHASMLGEPVYAAMGFRTVGTVRIYVRPEAPQA